MKRLTNWWKKRKPIEYTWHAEDPDTYYQVPEVDYTKWQTMAPITSKHDAVTFEEAPHPVRPVVGALEFEDKVRVPPSVITANMKWPQPITRAAHAVRYVKRVGSIYLDDLFAAFEQLDPNEIMDAVLTAKDLVIDFSTDAVYARA